MGRILIVHYSLTGTTRQAADALAEACGADEVEITDAKPRRGPLGALRSVWEALRRTEPPIRTEGSAPAPGDLTVLATPVWAGRMASPMRSWLAANRRSLGRVAFLATEGANGAEGAFKGMSDVSGKAPEATLILTAKDVESGADADKIARFANTLRAAASAGT
jgi:flavodoxin